MNRSTSFFIFVLAATFTISTVFCMNTGNGHPVPCVTISKSSTHIDEHTSIIKELATHIDCSSAETLCKTVHNETLNQNLLPFMPFAIQHALQEQNKSIEQRDNKKTALHWACMYGYTDCAHALIEATKNTNHNNPFNKNAFNNNALQRLLLSTSTSGQTALHWACKNGKVNCAKVILKAAKECGVETIQKLLTIKDLGYPDKYQTGGKTAYHKAYLNCKTDCIELLKLVHEEINLELPNPWDS